MTPTITNTNLHLLLPGKVIAVAKLYVKHHGGTLLEAIRLFYRSKTYQNLEQEETKLWHYGPVALYQEFEENR